MTSDYSDYDPGVLGDVLLTSQDIFAGADYNTFVNTAPIGQIGIFQTFAEPGNAADHDTATAPFTEGDRYYVAQKMTDRQVSIIEPLHFNPECSRCHDVVFPEAMSYDVTILNGATLPDQSFGIRILDTTEVFEPIPHEMFSARSTTGTETAADIANLIYQRWLEYDNGGMYSLVDMTVAGAVLTITARNPRMVLEITAQDNTQLSMGPFVTSTTTIPNDTVTGANIQILKTVPYTYAVGMPWQVMGYAQLGDVMRQQLVTHNPHLENWGYIRPFFDGECAYDMISLCSVHKHKHFDRHSTNADFFTRNLFLFFKRGAYTDNTATASAGYTAAKTLFGL